MNDFLLRTINDASKVEVELEDDGPSEVFVKVSRTRTSNGYSVIKLEVADQKIEFSSEKFGSGYEIVAREASEMLDKIALNPCNLPKAV